MLSTKIRFSALLLSTLALAAACGGPHSETKTGAAVGGAAGATAGAIIGDDFEGAAIGGLAGAAVGGLIGHLNEVDR